MTRSKFLTALLVPMLVFAMENAHSIEKKNLDINNPYFTALLQIGMTKDQVPEFKQLINNYAQNLRKAIAKVRRRNLPEIPRRIKRAQKKVRKNFVSEMDELLNDEQMSRFPKFHVVLDEMLEKRAPVASISSGSEDFKSSY